MAFCLLKVEQSCNAAPTSGKIETMNSPQPLSYPQEQLPEPGVAVELAPGVRWLRMPLPFALNHINLWLIEDGVDASGSALWTAVDTGVCVDIIKDNWRLLLKEYPLRRQIVTHCHPDHLGLAAWLEKETGAPLWMTLGEYLTAHMLCEQIDGYSIARMLELFKAHGLDEPRLEALGQRGNAYRNGVPEIPSTYRRLFVGQDIAIGRRNWRVMVGFGHSPEHAALYCEEAHLLISGDMLLPRISTNISVMAANPDSNPLGLFLGSIARFKTLPEDTLVLPSHGLPFRGIHARVAQLEDHHKERCAALLAACTTPKTACELIPVLFSREISDAHQAMFAMGEAMAHLNYLEQAGSLRRLQDRGTTRFVIEGNT